MRACVKQESSRVVWKNEKLVKKYETSLERNICVKGEPCVEQDEIDEKSVANPGAGVLIWNAGSTFCAQEQLGEDLRARKKREIRSTMVRNFSLRRCQDEALDETARPSDYGVRVPS